MRAFIVKPVLHKVACEVIEQYHYSHTMPTGKNVCFGLFLENEVEPYAVAVYGTGVSMDAAKYLSRVTGLVVTNAALHELKRLARRGEKGEALVPLTRFLAICHRLLQQTGTQFVYSFSDPEHSHCGTIYKAANFVHLGMTQAETHFTAPDGSEVHRRTPYQKMKRMNSAAARTKYPELFAQRCEQERLLLGKSVVTAEIKARQAKLLLKEHGDYVHTFGRVARGYMKLKPRKTEAKHRWFLPLIFKDRSTLLDKLKPKEYK